MINKILTMDLKSHQKDLVNFAIDEQRKEVQEILTSPSGIQIPIRETIPCGFKIKAVRVRFFSIQTTVSCGDSEGEFTLLCHACNAIFRQIRACKVNTNETDANVENNECRDGYCIDNLKKLIASHPYISIATAISVVGFPFVCAMFFYRSIQDSSSETIRSRRIINGRDMDDICFMAQFKYRSYSHGCGGTIVSDTQIITAAHCIEPEHVKSHIYRDYIITVGHSSISSMSSKCTFNVKSIEANAKIIDKYYAHDSGDIAVVTIVGNFSSAGCNVCKIDFITPNERQQMQNEEVTYILSTKVKPNLVAYGWGRTSQSFNPNKLQGVALHNYRVDKHECSKNKICAGYYDIKYITDTCLGDSGGALVFFSTEKNRGVLAGIVSAAGIMQEDCGDGHLSEYTEINFNQYWLNSRVDAGGKIKRYTGNPLDLFISNPTTTPAPSTTMPAPTTTTPAPTTTMPAPSTTMPAPSTTTPELSTTTPAPTTTTPELTTTMPAPTTTTPEPTITTPAPSTTTLALGTTMVEPTTTTPASLDIKPILLFSSGALLGAAVASSSLLLAAKYRSNTLCFRKKGFESVPSADPEEEIEMEHVLKFV